MQKRPRALHAPDRATKFLGMTLTRPMMKRLKGQRRLGDDVIAYGANEEEFCSIFQEIVSTLRRRGADYCAVSSDYSSYDSTQYSWIKEIVRG